MQRAAAVAMMLIALGAATPARAQVAGPPVNNPPVQNVTRGTTFMGGVPPVGIYVMSGVFCAAVSPMIGTVVLGRPMTQNEVWRSTLGCFAGPLGWLIADQLVPPTPPPPSAPPPRRRRASRANVSVPPPAETRSPQ
jgi:hypothetical protein